MSRVGQILVLLILVATVVLEVVVYFAVRSEIDGQAVLLNVFILIYAAIAVSVVWVADRIAQSVRATRRNALHP